MYLSTMFLFSNTSGVAWLLPMIQVGFTCEGKVSLVKTRTKTEN